MILWIRQILLLTPLGDNLGLWVITFDLTSGYDSVHRMIVDSDTLQASPMTNFGYPAYILKFNKVLSSSQNMATSFLWCERRNP